MAHSHEKLKCVTHLPSRCGEKKYECFTSDSSPTKLGRQQETVEWLLLPHHTDTQPGHKNKQTKK